MSRRDTSRLDGGRGVTLLAVRAGQAFLAEGNPFDNALAALDLAIYSPKEGKTAEARELADEMVTSSRKTGEPAAPRSGRSSVGTAGDQVRPAMGAAVMVPSSKPARSRRGYRSGEQRLG